MIAIDGIMTIFAASLALCLTITISIKISYWEIIQIYSDCLNLNFHCYYYRNHVCDDQTATDWMLLALVMVSSLKLEFSKPLIFLIVGSLWLQRSYTCLKKICLINGILLLQEMLISEQHTMNLFKLKASCLVKS